MILDGQSTQSIEQAAQALKHGDLLGLPTETVYGLAADAGNDAAVAKIFKAKGRPVDHPLIVHVANAQAAQRFARDIPEFATKLMQAFWPGPLTLIVPRQPDQAAAAAGGHDSVGLRCPSHPVALAVLKRAHTLGVMGVAAPSANLFGRVSPTTAAHVLSELGDGLLILDGGACEVGIESAIVDCTRGHPVLLRPGVLTLQALSLACGETVCQQEDSPTPAPRASGTLVSHYAPHARLRLMEADVLNREAMQRLARGGDEGTLGLWVRDVEQVSALASDSVVIHTMPSDPQTCAHELFAQLRRFDQLKVREIWVQTPPHQPQWAGVLDRLMRAAA